MFGPIKRKAKEKEDPSEKLREQQETARVYAEFVKSFQVEDDHEHKAFIRGGIIDPNASAPDPSEASFKSKLYKPTSKKSLWLPPPSQPLKSSLPTTTTITTATTTTTPTTSPTQPTITTISSSSSTQTTLRTELGRGIGGIDGLGPASAPGLSGNSAQSKTREIDTFLEEIKKKQELLDQRKQLRQVADSSHQESERELAKKKLLLIEAQTRGTGSIPGLVEAEETTNLYLGNLAPEITEEYLCQQFGKYGRIASVKIMYPRIDPEAEKTGRRRLCGFCSFETRGAAQAAKDALDGTEMLGQVVRIGWGKAISKPVSTPTPLSVGVAALSGVPLSMTVPPRISKASGFSDLPPEEMGNRDYVRVRVPRDRRQKALIDTVARYVAEDGHPIEQALIERNTELFRFLRESETDESKYYRWRVYAFSQGDTLKSWRTEPFQMFFGGREWVPPGKEYFQDAQRKSNFSSEGNEIVDGTTPGDMRGAKRLNEETRDELEDVLRNLTRGRQSVLEAMALCLDHSDAALEITECLMESLTIEKTPIETKTSRLYLLSDILHNSSCSRQAAWAYRGAIEKFLPEIFNHHNKVLRQLNGRLTIQAFKDRVMKVLRVWEDWAIYPPLFTKGLEASFLKDEKTLQNVFAEAIPPLPSEDSLVDPHLDGEPYCNKLMSTEALSKYPFWLRENLLDWNGLDLSNLERLCRRRGLSVSPELDNVSQSTTPPNNPEWNNDDNSEKSTEPSYSGMRQLLIKRLIECEAYWRARQIQNARAFAVLDKDTTADPININTRDLIQSVLADVIKTAKHKEVSGPLQSTVAKNASADDDDIFSGSRNDKTVKGQTQDYYIEHQVNNWVSSIAQNDQDNSDGPGDRTLNHLESDNREQLRLLEVEVMKFQLALEKDGLRHDEIQRQCEDRRRKLTRELESKLARNQEPHR